VVDGHCEGWCWRGYGDGGEGGELVVAARGVESAKTGCCYGVEGWDGGEEAKGLGVCVGWVLCGDESE